MAQAVKIRFGLLLCLAAAVLAVWLLGGGCLTPLPVLPVSPVSPVSAFVVQALSTGSDLDGDGLVGDRDLAVFRELFDVAPVRLDLNGDGSVDIFDVVLVAYAYGDDYRQKLYLPIIFR